ncbi:MAG: GatB/YqeY domain-containing protein [Clostridia bacterium]|nr:GatB/YqeY domain-containing protein [Clostridia bacterium]MCI8964919.1 GatB/YqeY domain-containing protein [Clostridia bacterium]
MMLKENLMNDLKSAMKEKNELKKNTIQMVRAAILQIEKDKQIELDDSKIIDVIAKEVKKRNDSISDYEKGGRADLVNQIKEEIEYLKVYLPKQLSIEEVEKIVKDIIEETQAKDIKDMGKVMKAAKEKIGASSDGKTINEIVKKFLS